MPCQSRPCSPSFEKVLTARSPPGVWPAVRNRTYRRSSETDALLLRGERHVRDLRQIDEDFGVLGPDRVPAGVLALERLAQIVVRLVGHAQLEHLHGDQ